MQTKFQTLRKKHTKSSKLWLRSRGSTQNFVTKVTSKEAKVNISKVVIASIYIKVIVNITIGNITLTSPCILDPLYPNFI